MKEKRKIEKNGVARKQNYECPKQKRINEN